MTDITMYSNGKRAEVLIYSPISGATKPDGKPLGISAKGFAESISALGDVAEMDVRISSPGGDVFQGMAIYNTLKQHSAKVRVFIDGVAASMATVIAMAGDEIEMAENAVFMIHEPRASVSGTSEDLVSQAALLEKLTSQVVAVYAARTGIAEADIRAAMAKETWYSAAEAKAAGFVTKIGSNKKLTAHFDVSQFSNAPDWAQTQMQALFASDVNKEPEMTTETPKAEVPNIDAIKAQASEAARAEERNRITQIHALCKRAGKESLADAFCEKGLSVGEVQTELFNALCSSNAPVGDAGTSPADESTDENASYKAEYKAGSYSMTEEQYVSLRRAEDGLEPFVK